MRCLVYVSVAIALTSCGRDRATHDSARASARSPTKQVEPSQQLAPLIARLRYEQIHRPPARISAERVLDALERAGVGVRERRQFLGATVRAAYCAGGTTVDDVAISVCEYRTPEAALAGKQLMDKRFAAMSPNAHRVIRDRTVLSVVELAAKGSTARILERFAAIEPQEPK